LIGVLAGLRGFRDKLVYFGMSVFWRAAVHRWHMPAGDPVPINLGPYEDPIRAICSERPISRSTA
jgi:hypothetical protein